MRPIIRFHHHCLTSLLITSLVGTHIGCASAAKRQIAAGSDSPAVAVPATRSELRVLYASDEEPVPLSADQQRGIISEALAFAPDGAKIWFVYVIWNYESVGVLYFRGRVFLVPTSTSGRIRKGQSLPLVGSGTEFRAGHIQDYCQVSGAGVTFDRGLELPTESLLPFPPVSDERHKTFAMSDAQLVRLVDAARAEVRTECSLVPPFTSIRKVDDGFHFVAGYQSGIDLTLQQAGDRYLKKGTIGWWTSE